MNENATYQDLLHQANVKLSEAIHLLDLAANSLRLAHGPHVHTAVAMEIESFLHRSKNPVDSDESSIQQELCEMFG